MRFQAEKRRAQTTQPQPPPRLDSALAAAVVRTRRGLPLPCRAGRPSVASRPALQVIRMCPREKGSGYIYIRA